MLGTMADMQSLPRLRMDNFSKPFPCDVSEMRVMVMMLFWVWTLLPALDIQVWRVHCEIQARTLSH